MYTVTEAAARLGMTAQNLRYWIRDRKIAYAKVGNRYRIPKEAVDQVLTIKEPLTPRNDKHTNE